VPAFNLEDYQTVDERLHEFWTKNPQGRVLTDLITASNEQFIVKASIWRSTGFGGKSETPPDATGYAEERVNASPVNRTSALENAETSAIGRALANLGYSTKGARPSQQEMAKAARQDQKTAVMLQAEQDMRDAATLDRLDAIAKHLKLVCGEAELSRIRPLYLERRKDIFEKQKAGAK
jgi:hypothetical protein